jgi:hypothetical protein
VNRDVLKLYHEACAGSIDAFAFLMAFHCYAHGVDDLIDEGCTPAALLGTLAHANAMYSTPFWLANSARLGAIITVVANTYADSVEWEKSPETWQRTAADVLRQCGNDMVCCVAYIVGGWQHMRTISLRLREVAYNDQHQEVSNG